MNGLSETREHGAAAPGFRIVVAADSAGQRLDVLLAQQLPAHSRTALKKLVQDGGVLVDGETAKPSHRVGQGQVVSGSVAAEPGAPTLDPEAIALTIIHEDASVVVVNKPAGLVVHPGTGVRDGTLANALAFHIPELSDIGGVQRPGIVHRLDRDTSGVMVVAKTNCAHFALSAQFQQRETAKEYQAIVEGAPDLDGDIIRRPIGRSRTDPTRMGVDAIAGKAAETRWEVRERFNGFAWLTCFPKTGRTHQIRVHLQSIHHPIVADPVYGRRSALFVADLDARPRDARADAVGNRHTAVGDEPVLIARHALHAAALEFTHPLSGRRMRFEAPLPPDFVTTLAALRERRPHTRSTIR